MIDCTGAIPVFNGDRAELIKLAAELDLPMNDVNLYKRIAESLKWTYDYICESGFFIKTDNTFGPQTYSNEIDKNAIKSIQQYEEDRRKVNEKYDKLIAAHMKNRKKEGYNDARPGYVETQEKARQRELKPIDEAIENIIALYARNEGSKSNLGIPTENDKSTYHSHPLGLNTVASKEDKRVLQNINVIHGKLESSERWALLAAPSTKTSCEGVEIMKYNCVSLDAGSAQTGIFVKYR